MQRDRKKVYQHGYLGNEHCMQDIYKISVQGPRNQSLKDTLIQIAAELIKPEKSSKYLLTCW